MVVHKERKHKKFRGHRAQGYGSHKKHRGGGSRGGRGKAGMHKHKWSYTVKYEPDHFIKYGFKRPQGSFVRMKGVNVSQLDEQAERLLQEKIAVKEGELIRIDVSKLGFDKVLGGGQLRNKLIIEAKSFSEGAKKKIEEFGGQAVIAAAEKKKKIEQKAEQKVEEQEKKMEAKKEKPKIKSKSKQKSKAAKKKK